MMTSLILIPMLAFGPPGGTQAMEQPTDALSLRGELVETDGGVMRHGDLTLRGRLIATDRKQRRTAADETEKLVPRPKVSDSQNSSVRFDALIVDGKGQVLATPSLIARAAHRVEQIDLNGDSLLDFITFDEGGSPHVSLIDRGDGRFDVVFDKGDSSSNDNTSEFTNANRAQETFEQPREEKHSVVRTRVEQLIDAVEALADRAPELFDTDTAFTAEFDDFDADGTLDVSLANEDADIVVLVFCGAVDTK